MFQEIQHLTISQNTLSEEKEALHFVTRMLCAESVPLRIYALSKNVCLEKIHSVVQNTIKSQGNVTVFPYF
jgi:hypothetical protein